MNMKNIRKFETTAAMDAATLEDVSINYNAETNGVLTLPLGGVANSIKNYMRFVAIEDSQINLTSVNFNTGEADTSVDLKHSKDGLTWTQYDFNPIPLAAGETLYLKGNNENGFSYEDVKTGEVRLCTFGNTTHDGVTTGKFECHGNIMSLLYGDDFEDKDTIPNMGCFTYTLAVTPITTAPELPATTLTESCYAGMFGGCESLTTAPELPATTLSKECYLSMFWRCTSLNHITMLATDISASYCLSDWVDGVSSTGTFVKHPDMDSLPTGTSGIPNGWTVEDAVL
jgi:hypothetical protein